MSDQAKDDPQSLTCLRCGGAMFRCAIQDMGKLQLMAPVSFKLIPRDKGSFDNRASRVTAFVCEDCGFTELHAMNIPALKPKQ